MISLQQLGQQPPADDWFSQFGGSTEQPQTTTPPQGNYPTPPAGKIWAVQPDGSVKLQDAPPANPQQDPNVSFDPNGQATTTTPWATVTPPAASKPATAQAPQFTAGMTPEQVRAAVTQFYSSKGVTPNATSVDYWVQKWGEFGNNDPAYFTQRLGQADEFGGGANGLGGRGSITAPYGGQFNLPSEQDILNNPAFKAGLATVQKSRETRAAYGGTLLTGGTQAALDRDVSDYTMGQYYNLANLSKGAFDTNYGIFRNNQNDPWSKLYQLSSLGLQGATA